MARFHESTCARSRTGSHRFVALVLLAGAAVMVVLTGCTSPAAPAKSGSGGTSSVPSMKLANSTASMTAAAGVADANVQVCGDCSGGTMAPMVKGSSVMEGGVQVLRIVAKNGHYEPNQITVKAGVPLTVIFTGKAKGCLANPVFPDLGKKADFTGGTATVDLGSLAAGTYKFTCKMKMNAGTITAQ